MSGKLQLTGMLHATLYYIFRYITMLLLYICVSCEAAKMQTDIFQFQSVIMNLNLIRTIE